jgi:hypothetical protein
VDIDGVGAEGVGAGVVPGVGDVGVALGDLIGIAIMDGLGVGVTGAGVVLGVGRVGVVLGGGVAGGVGSAGVG